jgi:hypothetical protein
MKSFLFASLLTTALCGCVVSNLTCYADNVSARILPSMVVAALGAGMTQEYCAQLCADAKMSMAGVEDGAQCFCGNALPASAKVVDIKNCSTKCSADRSQDCGGFGYAGVFKVSCSGDPVPTPPHFFFSQCSNMTSIHHTQTWCDPTVPISIRVSAMIAQMTTAEKIQNMMVHTGDVKNLSIPAYKWWEESTHGISPNDGGDGTNFAFPITTGAAFNRSLWRATGRQIGREARAYMNVGKIGSTFWAPVVNIARDGRWGEWFLQSVTLPTHRIHVASTHSCRFHTLMPLLLTRTHSCRSYSSRSHRTKHRVAWRGPLRIGRVRGCVCGRHGA